MILASWSTPPHALAYFGEDIGAMTTLVDRALALNPNSARGWHVSGVLKALAGQPDIAIEHSEVSLRLSPRARVGSTLNTIGAAHFFARRFDQAAPKFLVAIQDDPDFSTPYRYLAACYAHGTARRGTSDCRTVAGHYLRRNTGRQLPAERRAP